MRITAALIMGLVAMQAFAQTNAPSAPDPAQVTLELPSGSRQSAFDQELLPSDRQHSVLVMAVSMVLVKWTGLIIAAVVAALLIRERKQITEVLRSRLRPNEA